MESKPYLKTFIFLCYFALIIGLLIAFGSSELDYKYKSKRIEAGYIEPGLYSFFHHIFNLAVLLFIFKWCQTIKIFFLAFILVIIPGNFALIMFVQQCYGNPIGSVSACYQINSPLTVMTLINLHIYWIFFISSILHKIYMKRCTPKVEENLNSV